MSFIIEKWRSLTNRERRYLLVGIFIGIIAMAPVLFIDVQMPTPTAYTVQNIQSAVEYNAYYYQFIGEIGNYTTGDELIIVIPAFDGNDYKNIAVTLMSSNTYWRYICVFDTNGTTIEKQIIPESGNTYNFENIENLGGLAIFLHSTTPIYTIELWVW